MTKRPNALDEAFEAGYRRAWADLRARVKAVSALDEAALHLALREEQALRPVDEVPPELRARTLPGKVVAWDENNWWGVILLDERPLKINFHGTCVAGGAWKVDGLHQLVEIVINRDGHVLRVNPR